MREAPKKPTCFGCPYDVHYTDAIPKKSMGVMMHLGERFCTGGRKARRFRRGDPKTYVPDWCPKRKSPCELRVYAFKNVDEWWLHTMLERSIGRRLTPNGSRCALVREMTTELSPREFWNRLESAPYQEILDIFLEPHSVVEIDDGLKPVFFFYAGDGFTLLPSFEAEAARKNKKEA